MMYGIDFDGVLCEREGIPRVKSIKGCKPVKDALQAVKWIMEQGHTVYIFTNRDADEVIKWMDKWKFPWIPVHNIKLPDTTMYIDDRAVRFTNWQDICKLLG